MKTNLEQNYANRYQILQEIGRGGMGCVYKAYDKRKNIEVALKILLEEDKSQEKSQKRFLRETQAINNLDHKNIIRIYDIFIQPKLFYTMEYIPGKPFKELISSYSKRQNINILIKIAKAVHHMHQNGIIHRDIKPSNILITTDKEPILIDFGLAKIAYDNDDLTKTGDAMGTIQYASPEQIFGKKIDHKTDIYSLGVILYQIMYGRLPFSGETHENTLFAILNGKIKFSSKKVPQYLQAICRKALAKEPKNRYDSVIDFAKDLYTKKRIVHRSKKRNPTLIAFCMVVIVSTIYLTIQNRNNNASKPSSTFINRNYKKSQIVFNQHREHFNKHELLKAWKKIKEAIDLHTTPYYYVYAWRTYKSICGELKKEIVAEEKINFFNTIKPYLLTIKNGNSAQIIFARGFLQISESLEKAEIILNECYQKFQLSEAAVHLINIYHQKRKFTKATILFNSIKEPNAHIYVAYGNLLKEQQKNSSHMYKKAMIKGHINAPCMIADYKFNNTEKIKLFTEAKNRGSMRGFKALRIYSAKERKAELQIEIDKIEISLLKCKLEELNK